MHVGTSPKKRSSTGGFGYVFWMLAPYAGTTSLLAWTLIPVWFALQLGLARMGERDGPAYWTHVGGLVAGLAATLLARLGNCIANDADEVTAESVISRSVRRAFSGGNSERRLHGRRRGHEPSRNVGLGN